MIRVTVYQESGHCRGFKCEGHAGYAEEGSDIICAAVSALTVNAVNSVERFTDDRGKSSVKEGYLEFTLDGGASDAAVLLLDSMVSGLADIQDTYGKKYITLMFKEV